MKILTCPNLLLSQKCFEVKEFNEKLKDMADSMLIIMKENKGVGLAAPQIGDLSTMFVMQITKPLIVINPKILEYNGNIVSKEACLSLPGVFENIIRYENIKLQYQDTTGKEIISDFNGLESICIQHEMDHLNGITLLDKLSLFKRTFYLNKLKKRL